MLNEGDDGVIHDDNKWKMLEYHFKLDSGFVYLNRYLYTCNPFCKNEYLPHEFVYTNRRGLLHILCSIRDTKVWFYLKRLRLMRQNFEKEMET